MNTLTRIVGMGMLVLSLAGCGRSPVLQGTVDGKKYTLNYSPTPVRSDSIVEEKTDGTNSTTTEIFLNHNSGSPNLQFSFLDYSENKGFTKKSYSICPGMGSVSVHNSTGEMFYSARDEENAGIIIAIGNNLVNAITQVASNKNAKTERLRNEILGKLNLKGETR